MKKGWGLIDDDRVFFSHTYDGVYVYLFSCNLLGVLVFIENFDKVFSIGQFFLFVGVVDIDILDSAVLKNSKLNKLRGRFVLGNKVNDFLNCICANIIAEACPEPEIRVLRVAGIDHVQMEFPCTRTPFKIALDGKNVFGNKLGWVDYGAGHDDISENTKIRELFEGPENGDSDGAAGGA